MSVAVRRALYGKLAGDVTLTALLASPPAGWGAQNIFHAEIPGEADYPAVVLNKQSGVPVWSIGGKAYDNEVWQVKGITDADYGDADPVDTIAGRIDALLNDASLTLAGGKLLLYIRREGDVEYAETVGDKRLQHAGGLYRLMVQ